MKKVFARYTCSACGQSADSDTPLMPKDWGAVRFTGFSASTNNNLQDLEDEYVCSIKCAISLLTKAASTLVETP